MKPVESNVIEQESIQERNLALFLKNFPGVVSTDEQGELVINTDKLKLALDPKVRFEENGYELNWVGKKEAYHTAYAKQAKILKPLQADSKLLDPDAELLEDSTENILIKGDNLEVLKLLKNSYFEQVKMIYIDPPYNTKSENFIYRDNFTESEQSILDELGYSAEYKDYIENIQGARTHSGWLSFMFPRLLIARDLLKNDGVIFISIDDNEQANLKLLCDEVFGEQNFLGSLFWKRRSSSALAENNLSLDHEYVLVYGQLEFDYFIGLEKDFSAYKNPDKDPRGEWVAGDLTVGMTASMRPNQAYELRDPTTGISYPCNPNRVWAYAPNSMQKLLEENRVIFSKNSENRPMLKRFKNELKSTFNPFSSIMVNQVGLNTEATKQIQDLLGGAFFNYSKPLSLLQTIVAQVTGKKDIVLDFFAGSGTTGQAVMDLNAQDGGQRKFILVQLAEEIDAKKQKDAYNFVTKTLHKDPTIFEITAERLRRAGEKVKADYADHPNIENIDIGFKVFEVADDPMQQFFKPLQEVEPEDLKQLEIMLSAETVEETLPTILTNLLLAEKLPLSTVVTCIEANSLYQANNVLLIVKDLPIETIKQHVLENQQQVKTQPDLVKVEYVSLYSPGISGDGRDKFSQELKPALLQLGFDESKLRFRG